MTSITPADHDGIAAWNKSYLNSIGHGFWSDEPVPFYQQIAIRYKDRGFVRVLDAPCGDGRNLFHLASAFPLAVGLDSSPNALTLLAGQFGRHGTSNILLTQGDIFNLPFPNEHFDLVACWDLLGHLQSPVPAIRELCRVCRKSGIVIGSLFSTVDETRGVDMIEMGAEEYLYGPAKFYFKFYTQQTVAALLTEACISSSVLEHESWTEPPHPGYREYAHKHSSWVFTFTPN